MTNETYSLTVEKILSATPEMIFDAWLDENNINAWMKPGEAVRVPNPKIDAKVGGKFDLTMDVGEQLLPHVGEYKKIDRPTELQFSWNSPGTHGLDTLVTITLEPIGAGKTKLTLVHNLLPDKESRDSHNGGWTRIVEELHKHMSK